jgi:hypothetical protein
MNKGRKPCTCPDGRIAIFDPTGAMREHCGPFMTAASVTRFGVKAPQLKTVGGKLEWHGQRTKQRPRPETASHKASRGSVKPRG